MTTVNAAVTAWIYSNREIYRPAPFRVKLKLIYWDNHYNYSYKHTARASSPHGLKGWGRVEESPGADLMTTTSCNGNRYMYNFNLFKLRLNFQDLAWCENSPSWQNKQKDIGIT